MRPKAKPAPGGRALPRRQLATPAATLRSLSFLGRANLSGELVYALSLAQSTERMSPCCEKARCIPKAALSVCGECANERGVEELEPHELPEEVTDVADLAVSQDLRHLGANGLLLLFRAHAFDETEA